MNRSAVLLAMGVLLLGRTLTAQSNPPAAATPPTTSAATPSPVCLPASTLDEMIKSLDDAVSGPLDKDRTCMRELLFPDARLIPVGKATGGEFAPRVLTVDQWVDAMHKRGSGVFYERQVKVEKVEYGHIAHLWSTYEIRPTPDARAALRGINSIQAVYVGKSWKIMEILWQAETNAEPVPGKYLP
jgi:hypothetical protein